MSQVKAAAKASNTVQEEMLRKLTFIERRQQLQDPSLAELARESEMAWGLAFSVWCAFLVDQFHKYCLKNSIFGCLCACCHACACCVTCCCHRRQASKAAAVTQEEADNAAWNRLQEKVQANEERLEKIEAFQLEEALKASSV